MPHILVVNLPQVFVYTHYLVKAYVNDMFIGLEWCNIQNTTYIACSEYIVAEDGNFKKGL